MIYNLVQYLIVQLPALVFVANGWSPDSPIESVTIKQTGGGVSHHDIKTDFSVQVLSRAKSSTKAYKQIKQVFDLLKNRFGLELPSVTADGIFYDTVKAYQISPMQAPGYIEADEKNLELWSYNMIVTTT